MSHYDFPPPASHVAVSIGATSGDQTIVAAAAGKKVRVLGYQLVAKTAVDLQFKDTAGSTFSGAMHLPDNGQLDEPFSPYPVFDCGADKGLVINLSAAAEVCGYINYRTI